MKKCSEFKEYISLYIDNELDADVRKEFEEHIESCDSCRQEFEDITKIIGICNDFDEEELPQNFNAELHEKLVHVNQQENRRKKITFLTARNMKIFSTIAAGILLIFLTKGFFESGLINPKNGSTDNMSVKSDDTLSAKSMPQKESATGGASVASDAIGVEDAKNGVNYNSSSQNKLANNPVGQAGKVEMNRSATNSKINDEIVGFAGPLTSKKEAALNSIVCITILIEKPETQLTNINTIAVKNSGEELPKPESAPDAVKTAITEDNTDDITINYLIPTVQYDAFKASLNTSYGQSNIQFGEVVTEDLTEKLNSLIAQSDSLNSEIKQIEGKNDTSDKDKLNNLRAEKEAIDKNIESIRLGSDFINVTIVLKRN